MPIKSLTNKEARPPLLGVIRKGEAKTVANKPGKDSEFFRLDSKFPKIMQQWDAVMGKECNKISCLILSPTTEGAFPCWMEEWGAAGLVTRCDEEKQQIWWDDSAKKLITSRPKPCKQNCGCKAVGRLNIMIPDMGEFGVFVVETHSKWDIISLNGQLSAIEQAAGTLFGIPFLLERTNREITVPYGGENKRSRATKSLLSIRVHPDKASKILVAAEKKAFAAITGVDEIPMLQSAPIDIVGEVVAEEINPDQNRERIRVVQSRLNLSSEQIRAAAVSLFGLNKASSDKLTTAEVDRLLEALEAQLQHN